MLYKITHGLVAIPSQQYFEQPSRMTRHSNHCTGAHRAVGNMSDYRYLCDCRSRGRKFDPAWYHTFVEIDEIISMDILLPSADLRRASESMCIKNWLTREKSECG